MRSALDGNGKKSNIQQPFGGKLFDDKEKEILGRLSWMIALLRY
jgi:hypothetical protein